MSQISGLDNPERIRLLEIIDEFRNLGLNESISLPQLVVVGDQSSGKSSLLEGITNLYFPVASDLCTRHATQIVLRQARPENASVKFSIVPGPTALRGDEQHKQRLDTFQRVLEVDATKFTEKDSQEFSTILAEAAIVMGLPGPTDDPLQIGKRFSDDILKIELSGPAYYPLSVVDVPGLFHNPTKFQTEEDKVIIRDLIIRYIKDPRTIILAVLDARNNLANQEVFRMARKADPDGVRTVGIITKCDALGEGDEPGVLAIAKNEVERLTHGWFVVKNRSTKEIAAGVTIEQRHENEKIFFSRQPWTQLEHSRVGVPILRKFLGVLLYDHIRNEFPALLDELRSSIASSAQELEALGASRQTASEQRQFLNRMASKYQKMVDDSLSGHYDAGLSGTAPEKLRMHLQEANAKFGRVIRAKGHARSFRNVDGTVDKEYSKAISQEDIYDWIRVLYKQARGSELPGTLNPVVLENMFRQQSSPWEAIGNSHLSQIDVIVRNFNRSIFKAMIVDESLRAKIEARNNADSKSAYQEASKQLEQILHDERGGILQTINDVFVEKLAECRQNRVQHRLERAGYCAEDGQMSVDFCSLLALASLDNEEQTLHDIHDSLKSYYQVAVKRFMDNVVLQVVERKYLGPDGPVRSFTPDYVGTLTDQDLNHIAAESYSTASARENLTKKLERLEKALALAETQM